MYFDKLSTIQLAQNSVFHACAKHTDVHYHYISKRIVAGKIDLKYVHMDLQTTDIFTQSLGGDDFRQFLTTLRIRPLDVPNVRGSNDDDDNDDHDGISSIEESEELAKLKVMKVPGTQGWVSPTKF